MPLALLIILGSVGVVIYLLRLVTRLQDRVDLLERSVDELSYNLSKVTAKTSAPIPIAALQPEPEAQTTTESPQHAPTVTRLVEIRAGSRVHPIGLAGDKPEHTPAPIEVPPVIGTTPIPPPPPIFLTASTPSPAKIAINWEQFLGAKLFAWIGGLALFVGIAFFVKYSFDRDLIPPWMRVALGFVVGVGLVAGGIMTRRKEYLITAQTLVATGVVVLYSVSFLARSLYQLINTPVLFFLMSGITVAAFTLAIRLDARVVAVLGMLGGFLTPQLAPVTRDQPFVLFGYVLVLNIGLFAVARQRDWRFLIPLAAIASVLTETAWVLFHLRANLPGTLSMIGAITALFAGNVSWNRDSEGKQPASLFAGALQALLVFGTAWILIHQQQGWPMHPVIPLATLFFANIALLAMYAMTLHPLPLVLGVSGAGGLLAHWIGTGPSLALACGAALVYAILNALLPAWIAQRRATSQTWPGIASVAGLALLLLVLFRKADSGWFFWPTVLAANVVLLGVAFLRGSLILAACGTLGTALISMFWITNLPSDSSGLYPVLILGVFALIYFFLGGVLARKQSDPTAMYFPAFPAGLPFLLVGMLMLRLDLTNPTLLFGFAMVLNALLIFATPRGSNAFPLAGLAGSLFLQFLWFGKHLDLENAAITLAWHLAFSLAFTFYPLLRKRAEDAPLDWSADAWVPWYVSALAGPIHFFLIYGAAKLLWPQMAAPGLIPALLGIPAILMLLATRKLAPNPATLLRFTAVFGASALFFVTLIFPIQFDRQWLTIGWALEGVALLWLNRRAPAPWLVGLGSVLLVIAFSRLGFNLSVFQYQQRGAIPILNWYLYAYGIVAIALFTAARLTSGVQNGARLKAIFSGMGTLLLFLLMNIEIADTFATGPYLTFDFSGNFARDMTYSIAWSLFALTLLVIGVTRDVPAVRYAGLALMGATLLKLFFHDLTRLDALFRIGAFIGVAIILIFASWMYQRFLATTRQSNGANPSV